MLSSTLLLLPTNCSFVRQKKKIKTPKKLDFFNLDFSFVKSENDALALPLQ